MLSIRILASSSISRVSTKGVRSSPSCFTVGHRAYSGSVALRGNKYGDTFQKANRDQEPVAPRMNRAPIPPVANVQVAESWTRLSFTPAVTRSAQEVAQWRADHEITVTAAVLNALRAKFPAPLPIQSQGWSVALSGENMVGCADTGSGKTVAFLLPAFEHIRAQGPRTSNQGPVALVVAPTRELAQQIEAEALPFARAYRVQTACLFGGQSTRSQQIRSLSRAPSLVIATPGRLLDLADAGFVDISRVSFLVLDEADRMLDMGFGDDLRQILDRIQPDRQACMWTATWPKGISRLAVDYFSNYVRVNVGSTELTANPKVTQVVEVTNLNNRLDKLVNALDEHKDSKVLIFSGTKVGCDHLGSALFRAGYEDVATLHGDKTQAQRENILKDFKSGVLRCVIATDVASRGLDVKDIDLVINYDFPQNIETYIHRIGRTARAGKTGKAISYFTSEQASMAKELIEILKEAKQVVPRELEAMRSSPLPRGRKQGGGGGGGYGRGDRQRFGGDFGGFSSGYGNSRGGNRNFRGFGSKKSFDDDEDYSLPLSGRKNSGGRSTASKSFFDEFDEDSHDTHRSSSKQGGGKKRSVDSLFGKGRFEEFDW